MSQQRIRLCFVCLGNICRSPTAEAVMQKLITEGGLADRIVIDSAGTSAYHVGDPADARAAAAARKRGITMRGVSRQFERGDFQRFDYILAMDRDNFEALSRAAPTEEDRAKIHLFRSFDPASPAGAEVPDPYFGAPGGFDEVFDICDAACRGLLQHLLAEGRE